MRFVPGAGLMLAFGSRAPGGRLAEEGSHQQRSFQDVIYKPRPGPPAGGPCPAGKICSIPGSGDRAARGFWVEQWQERAQGLAA